MEHKSNKQRKIVSSNDEEREHFHRIVSAFKYYRTHSLQRVARSENYLNSLPEHHQKLLTEYRSHLQNIKACIEKNDYIIRLIIKDVAYLFENAPSANETEIRFLNPIASDLEKVQSTLKQFVRDWSDEGASERQCCYQPIIDEIISHFPADKCVPLDVKILVPGAGLGRLAFEIAKKGYTCQGNEFSLFMLFASNFVLNKCRGRNIYQVYPWVHQFVNNVKSGDQTKGVSFPDIDPVDISPNSQISMAAGDFLEIYTEKNEWDSVATCFFIDCANNIVAFIETIYNILKPGGVWINLGPLLYHFADQINESSIEPPYEHVRNVILGFGFEIEKEEINLKTTYGQNPNSMLQYKYKSVFFVCRKPKTNTDSSESERESLSFNGTSEK